MALERWTMGLVVTAFAAACSPAGSSDSPPGGAAGAGDGGSGAPSGAAGGPEGGGPTTGSSSSGGGGSGSAGGGGGGTAPPSTATLVAARAETVGRTGSDLRIDVKGSDPDGRTSAVHVFARDASGGKVVAFDTNWDGVPDSSDTVVPFDGSTLGQKSFTARATIRGLAASFPGIASVSVALEDRKGGRSLSVDANVAVQTKSALGGACDPALVTSRCELGLACGGSPATCQPGTAPALDAVAYTPSPNGPSMAAKGSDADQDLATLNIEFLDLLGNAVLVDLDGDGIPKSKSFALDVKGPWPSTAFLVLNEAALGFEVKVPKIRMTPIDANGHTGASKVASFGVPVAKASGSTCILGIDRCAPGLLCAPAASGPPACTAVKSLATAKCGAAPVIDPAKGLVVASGTIDGISLVDPPDGCIPGDAKARPEALVTIHLAAPAKGLTLTTARPETTVDTAIYLVSGCSLASSAAIGAACNDDDKGFSSTLHFGHLAAGDYTLVVESNRTEGGTFGVAASLD